MAGNFFRGTTVEQDGRWGKSEEKLIAKLSKSGKIDAILNHSIDIKKVNLDLISKWVNGRLLEILGFEDDIVSGLIINTLMHSDKGSLDGKKLQLDITGFLEDKAGTFMSELWNLLIDAQQHPLGIPSAFVKEKKEELLKREAESLKKQSDVSIIAHSSNQVDKSSHVTNKDIDNQSKNNRLVEATSNTKQKGNTRKTRSRSKSSEDMNNRNRTNRRSRSLSDGRRRESYRNDDRGRRRPRSRSPIRDRDRSRERDKYRQRDRGDRHDHRGRGYNRSRSRSRSVTPDRRRKVSESNRDDKMHRTSASSHSPEVSRFNKTIDTKQSQKEDSKTSESETVGNDLTVESKLREIALKSLLLKKSKDKPM